jgi:hypothetical protein
MPCYAVQNDDSSGAFYGGGASGYDDIWTHDKVDRLGYCKDGAPITCDAKSANNACEACMMTHCCVALTVANADANIAWFEKCVSECPDDQCKTNCAEHAKKMPDLSIKNLDAIASCIKGDCSQACQ